MYVTPTTPLACLVCLLILVLGPARGLILAVGVLPFASAAAINLSGLGSIFLAEVAVLSLGLSAVMRDTRARQILQMFRPGEAGLPLLGLVLIAAIGAVFLPRIYAGQTDVFSVVRQADGAVIALRPLAPGGSNLGQLMRFTLAIVAFVIMCWVVLRFAGANYVKRAVGFATGVHALLALGDLLSPTLGVSLLAPFRNAYVAVLDDQVLLGIRRLIGGQPEPSAFAIFTLGLFGYWSHQWFAAPKSVMRAIVALILLALLLRSTSTAAYLGLASYSVLFLIWKFRSVFRRRTAMLFYAFAVCLAPVLIGSGLLMFQFVPGLAAFVETAVVEKLSSESGTERVSWNMQALKNFVETFGMGAGIGSVRASGWLFALLGSLGVLGAGLYGLFLSRVLNARRPVLAETHPDVETWSALRAACAAILLMSLMLLPQPNLGLLFFVLAGMSVGLRMQLRAGLDVNTPVFLPKGWQFSSQRVS